MRRTKIVATIGPASSDPETVVQLLKAGMDVARLNFSHGTHESHARTIAMLRQVSHEHGYALGLLQDLQGPKIRTGPLTDGQAVELLAGRPFTITTREIAGSAEAVSTTYQALPHDVCPGDRILISDGLLELRVSGTTDDEVFTEVVIGGMLAQKQGINLPCVNVSVPALTPKDMEDLEFGLAHGVDYIALSFVRRASDINEIKERIAAQGKDVPVIAKIEKPEALDDIEGILKRADGIMVARGDLGVEVVPEKLPIIQKKLIEAANIAGKPVITATQMLDSMIRNPRPTRAEATDVANAILDGTDAVMLSGETATGSYPVKALEMMARIADEADTGNQRFVHTPPVKLSISHQHDVPHAISAATRAIVEALNVKAIVALTQSGNTARLISRQRPTVPIIAFTPSEQVYHRLTLFWGVTPIMDEYTDHLSDLAQQVKISLLENGFVEPCDLVVMTGGHPLTARGSTNFLKVLQIDEGEQMGEAGPMGYAED